MKKICFVSCVGKKLNSSQKAKDIYVSPWFLKASAIAKKYFDEWYILSAKYGLLLPDETIQPYNLTLNNMSKSERLIWTDKVFKQILNKIDPKNRITIFAGERYRNYLVQNLINENYMVEEPLKKLGIGKQLNWFDRMNDPENHYHHLEHFYTSLNKLKKSEAYIRNLDIVNGSNKWPEKGVYFFFDKNEPRIINSQEMRCVRVGTHGVSSGSKSKFWNRVKTHLGTQMGGGNHRASIFRLHVGNAIKNKFNLQNYDNWGKGQNASRNIKEKEIGLEQKVSSYIKSLSLIWLDINDESGIHSDRSYIERNSIALLSGVKGPVDIQTTEWLGNYSSNESIVKSGLWNVNYVMDRYDPGFLEVLDEYVEITLGNKKNNTQSLAPPNWYVNQREMVQFNLWEE